MTRQERGRGVYSLLQANRQMGVALAHVVPGYKGEELQDAIRNLSSLLGASTPPGVHAQKSGFESFPPSTRRIRVFELNFQYGVKVCSREWILRWDLLMST